MFSRDRSSNRGYAFVNFTTADAARGFHYALHRCAWKPVVRGRKTINIAAAHIQVYTTSLLYTIYPPSCCGTRTGINLVRAVIGCWHQSCSLMPSA
jgi:hypothetical protein